MRRIHIALGMFVAVAGCACADLTSTFDAGSEGWDVIDVAGLGDYATVLGSYTAEWSDVGGNPDGHVSLFDPSVGAFFFRAPAAYLGDQSALIGQELSFDVFTTDNTYSDDSVVVLVGGAPQKIIVTPITQPAADVWQSYAVPLAAEGFRLNNAAGPVVTAEEFADVLSSLAGLYVPGEFATGLVETTRLDNVTLVPEPGAALLLALAGVAIAARRSARSRCV